MMNTKLKPEDAAYLAGLLDGEAHFDIDRQHGVRVRLAMANRAFVESISAMIPWIGKFGGGKAARMNRKNKGENWKDVWRIEWDGLPAIKMCEAIEPFIRLKKEQVRLILEVRDLRALRAGSGYKQGAKSPEWYNKAMLGYIRSIKQLNRRGRTHEDMLPTAPFVYATVIDFETPVLFDLDNCVT